MKPVWYLNITQREIIIWQLDPITLYSHEGYQNFIQQKILFQNSTNKWHGCFVFPFHQLQPGQLFIRLFRFWQISAWWFRFWVVYKKNVYIYIIAQHYVYCLTKIATWYILTGRLPWMSILASYIPYQKLEISLPANMKTHNSLECRKY